MKRSEEIAFCVDPMCGLYTVCPRSFGLEAGRSYPGEGCPPLNFFLRRLLLLVPLPRPLMEMMGHRLHH
jgi:hypothetical protein